MIINGNPKISLDLRNGVYFLDLYPATGKSYLADELSSRVPDNSNIYVGTYKNGRYVGFGNRSSASVIMFDRLDMYFHSKVAKFIVEKSKDAIVIVDLKNLNLMIKYLVGVYFDIVYLEFDEHEIRVGDLWR